MQLKLPSRKSKVERLLDKVGNPKSLTDPARHAVEAAVAGASTASDPIKKAGKPALVVAAGLAGVAAANAGLSSLRKREGSAS